MLLGWVFPARPGLSSIICVLRSEAQWSNCFLGHTAKSAVWDTGLTLPWWYLPWSLCKSHWRWGAGNHLRFSWLCVFYRAFWWCPGFGTAALAAVRARWADGAALPEGFHCPGLLQWWDQNRLMTFLKRRLPKLPKQISATKSRFPCIYFILLAKLQKSNSASCLLQSVFKRPSKQCEAEEVSLNMTLTHQPQRLCFRFCVTACDCSSI